MALTHIEEHFKKFAEILETGAETGGEVTDYKTICATIGASPKALDEYLLSHFGLDGEDIVSSYCTATPMQFL